MMSIRSARLAGPISYTGNVCTPLIFRRNHVH
jgi:hypothetical protein